MIFYLLGSIGLLLLSLIIHYRRVSLRLSEVLVKRNGEVTDHRNTANMMRRICRDKDTEKASSESRVQELKEISDNALLRMTDMEARYDELIEKADKDIQEYEEMKRSRDTFLKEASYNANRYQSTWSANTKLSNRNIDLSRENETLKKDLEAKDDSFDVLRESLKAANLRNQENAEKAYKKQEALKEKFLCYKDAWRQLKSLRFEGDRCLFHGEDIGTFSEIKQMSYIAPTGKRFKRVLIDIDLEETRLPMDPRPHQF